MSVVIRKVLPEEVAELKVISEDTFRETFAHDNTEAQLQGYFDTALSEEVLLDEITHEESRYFFILVDGVWERNFKAQIFYDKYGFEKFAEHDFLVGDGKVDRDWLFKLKL